MLWNGSDEKEREVGLSQLLGRVGGRQDEEAVTASLVCACVFVVCELSGTLPCTIDPCGFLDQVPRPWWWPGQELNPGLYCSYLLGVG